MVDSRLAAAFWSAVKDCLTTFHHHSPEDAAEKVTGFWRSLSRVPVPSGEGQFADIVYHSEPWYIACDLAQSELPLLENLEAYQEILARNGLSAGTSPFAEATPAIPDRNPLWFR